MEKVGGGFDETKQRTLVEVLKALALKVSLLEAKVQVLTEERFKRDRGGGGVDWTTVEVELAEEGETQNVRMSKEGLDLQGYDVQTIVNPTQVQSVICSRLRGEDKMRVMIYMHSGMIELNLDQEGVQQFAKTMGLQIVWDVGTGDDVTVEG